MDFVRSKLDGEFDFEKLPEGVYYFSGKEGFVSVEVDRNGHQSWNLENWYASLDPDDKKEKRDEIIHDIKKRINAESGNIDSPKKKKKNLFNLFVK